MLKYLAVAAALKAFSVSPSTKSVYRRVGNTLGQGARTRHGLPALYVELAETILYLARRYNAVQEGNKILEIGTGWVHWESTILRLFYDVDVTLFDVWDNRHFHAYQRYLTQLQPIIDSEFEVSAQQRKRAHTLLARILDSKCFEEVYSILGFKYELDPSGTLKSLPENHFDLIFSFNVLEHVRKEILPEFTLNSRRILNSGGYSIHRIDLGDHLSYYDRSVSRKNYLRYSDQVWKMFFESDVQYFNRVQRPEWLTLFDRAGLTLVEEESRYGDIGCLPIADDYRGLTRKDLECTVMTVVHRNSDPRSVAL